MTTRIGPSQMPTPKPLEFEKPMQAETAVLTHRPTSRPRVKPDYKGDPADNPNLDPKIKAQLAAQDAMFQKHQAITMASNLKKADHDGKMAVIRNMKV